MNGFASPRAGILFAAIALATAGPAHAATVNAWVRVDHGIVFSGIDVIDDVDEPNDVEITRVSNDPRVRLQVMVRERGDGRLVASGECRQRSKRVVACPKYESIEIDLNGGDDTARVRVRRLFSWLKGGDGDDLLLVTRPRGYLQGGAGRDRLMGGRQADELYGGAGPDRLFGGPGRDFLSGDAVDDDTDAETASDDLVDGGARHDVVSWGLRTSPVSADLAAARGGGAGERDTLRSVESMSGGSAADTLSGDAGPNTLRGGDGRDVMRGRGGNDTFDGGSTDYLYGHEADGSRDRMGCGTGFDRAMAAVEEDPDLDGDALGQSCERLRIDLQWLRAPRLVPGARSVEVEVGCGRGRNGCRRQAILVSGGRVLGQSRLAAVGSRRTLRVPLEEPLGRGPSIHVSIDGESSTAGNPHSRYYALERPVPSTR